jgi:hypothetical protein
MRQLRQPGGAAAITLAPRGVSMFSRSVELCAIALALFSAFIFVMCILRQSAARHSTTPPPRAFDLVEIQGVLDSGKITRAEHARLRELVVKQGIDAPAQPSGPRGFEVVPASPSQEATKD